MRVVFSIAFTVLVFSTGCQSTQRANFRSDTSPRLSQTVEAGCATCIFHMKDVVGCELAVKIDGKPYLVTGSSIDDHGDAHAADGFCNASSQAVVEGKIENNRFVATKFKLEK